MHGRSFGYALGTQEIVVPVASAIETEHFRFSMVLHMAIHHAAYGTPAVPVARPTSAVVADLRDASVIQFGKIAATKGLGISLPIR